MFFKPLAAAAALTAAFAASGLAHADESGPQLKISGYGTVAAAVADDADAGFRRAGNISKGTTDKMDIGQDSRFGVQANVDFQAGLSAVGQVVAKRRITGAAGDDKDFDGAVDWLYGQYQFLPSTSVRIGRMALPTYLFSDSLNVGYAAPWLRAPVHIYGTNPMERLDGAQLNWRGGVGGVNLSAQLGYGKTKALFYQKAFMPTPVLIDADTVSNLNVTAEMGDWLGRFGISKAKAPLGALTVEDTYTSVGLQYDNGSALVLAEYAKRSQNDQPALGESLVGGKYAYVAAGWRFGKLLPLLMLSQAKQDFYSPFGRVYTTDHTVGASLRYDVAPNIALKGQIDRYSAKDSIAFANPRAGDNGKINVYTLGLDFVF
jgi:hypothetical protein